MPPSPLDLNIQGGSTPLANQVAGHQNVLSDESGALVIKPALPSEVAFYNLLNSASPDDPIAKLRPFVPTFYGTLKLQGKLDAKGELTTEGVGIKVDDAAESVVLENLSHSFTHPSIMDIKLGTELAGPDATPEKRERMDKQARETTTHETGMRLTGCQTWHAPTSSYILTPKSYGKSITKDQLPKGMSRFFPLPDETIYALPGPSTGLPPTPITGSDKPPTSFSDHAVGVDALMKLLSIADSELEHLTLVLQDLEVRIIGGSVLIVYEGDPGKLETPLKLYDVNRNSSSTTDHSETASNDADSDGDSDDSVEPDPLPLTVTLIDFAHTRMVPGEGPDSGVLKGLNSLRHVLRERAKLIRYVHPRPNPQFNLGKIDLRLPVKNRTMLDYSNTDGTSAAKASEEWFAAIKDNSSLAFWGGQAVSGILPMYFTDRRPGFLNRNGQADGYTLHQLQALGNALTSDYTKAAFVRALSWNDDLILSDEEQGTEPTDEMLARQFDARLEAAKRSQPKEEENKFLFSTIYPFVMALWDKVFDDWAEWVRGDWM